MSENYLLVCNGKRYENVPLDEVRRILIDEEHYSYARVKEMLDKVVPRDHAPATIEWEPGRNMNWRVDGVKMGRKCALFACEWIGCTKEESASLLHANQLCAEAQETIKTIRDTCKRIDAIFPSTKSP
jgi:hypothetical protein